MPRASTAIWPIACHLNRAFGLMQDRTTQELIMRTHRQTKVRMIKNPNAYRSIDSAGHSHALLQCWSYKLLLVRLSCDHALIEGNDVFETRCGQFWTKNFLSITVQQQQRLAPVQSVHLLKDSNLKSTEHGDTVQVLSRQSTIISL